MVDLLLQAALSLSGIDVALCTNLGVRRESFTYNVRYFNNLADSLQFLPGGKTENGEQLVGRECSFTRILAEGWFMKQCLRLIVEVA